MKNHGSAKITILPAFNDNYLFLLQCKITSKIAVIDPGDSQVISNYLKSKNLNLDFILCTHHHRDHTGGILALKQEFGATVIGSANDAKRIPGIDVEVSETNRFKVGDLEISTLSLDGHTLGHIGFWIESDKVLFCGDTLFSLGCGKLFEGTAEQMWKSLEKIRALPSESAIYCTHEYTLENGLFAEKVEPSNAKLLQYLSECKSKRNQGFFTIPTNLSIELECNPFFRVHSEEIRAKLGIRETIPWKVFGAIREGKDSFDQGENPFFN